jgi:glycosyltransferase involved in cell wall biosynthesis
MEPLISILIPTQGRLDQLAQLLEGLRRLDSRESITHEIIVANNAPDEAIASSVEGLVRQFAADEPERWIHVREPVPGKSRALNRAISFARGQILGFLDDDVEISPAWLEATEKFFRCYAFDVKQGAILIPPAMRQDQSFMKLLNRYRTICYYQKPGTHVREIDSLNAANIALRRELLSRTGLFDERIGPGRSGTSMDVEFGERVLRAGGRIGYEPNSVVYHNVDWSRLTESYFRLRHEMQGKSRLIYKRSTLATIIPNLLRAMWAFAWYSLFNNERKKYRAKGRYFHYRAMLREKLRRRNLHMLMPSWRIPLRNKVASERPPWSRSP